MTSGIYTITNTFNGKIYVGYSKNLRKRKNEHLSALRNNRHDNLLLQRVWNKYGQDSLLFEILEECEERFLVSLEHYWCTILNTHDRNYGYNRLLTNPEKISSGHSKETSLKISMSKKGVPSPLRGTKHQKETIDKMIESKRVKNNLKKKVKCLTDGEIFNSVKEASKFYGICSTTISNNINGITKINLKNLQFEFYNYVQEKYDIEDVSDFIDEFGVEPIRQELIKKGFL